MPFLAQTTERDFVPDYSERRYQPGHVIDNFYQDPRMVNETDYFAESHGLDGYNEPVVMTD